MGTFQAAAALWHVPFPGVISNLKWCFVFTVNKSSFAGLLCKVIIRQLTGFMFLLLLFWSQGFIAVYLKLPSSFGWVLFQPIIRLQHDWHTNFFQQKRACNTWGSICGGNLLEPLLLSFMGLFWSWYMGVAGDRLSCVSESPGTPVPDRSAIAQGQNHTKVTQVMLVYTTDGSSAQSDDTQVPIALRGGRGKQRRGNMEILLSLWVCIPPWYDMAA